MDLLITQSLLPIVCKAVLKSQQFPSLYHWWEEEVSQNHLTAVVVFKSVSDPEDESYLKRWDEVSEVLLHSKTIIYAVSTQKQVYLDNARARWRLSFDLICDREASIARVCASSSDSPPLLLVLLLCDALVV